MKKITFKVYQIDEHPNKEAVFDWIRNNWHDLNDHSRDEFVESLKELNRHVGGVLSYSISTVPDRGQLLSLVDYNKDDLMALDPDELPLTGVCWDYDIIKSTQDGDISRSLDSLHNDTEYIYSDEGLTEMCEANEYYFFENGEVYNG